MRHRGALAAAWSAVCLAGCTNPDPCGCATSQRCCPLTRVCVDDLSDCGALDPDRDFVTLSGVYPSPAELVAGCAPGAFAGMSAVLTIGGQMDCDLSVDAATATASGSCSHVPAGIVRPIMAAYRMAGPTDPVWVAAFAGYCDLRKPLPDDPPRSELVPAHRPADVAAFANASSGDTDLDLALEWAYEQLDGRSVTFDVDGDGTVDIDEICAGTWP